MTVAMMFVLLWAVVLINLLLTLKLVRYLGFLFDGQQTPPPIPTLPLGQPAPDFVARDLRGATTTLARYAQGAIVMLFVSQRCADCRAEIPTLVELYPLAQRAGVQLVMVTFDDRSEAESLVEEFGIPLTVLLAPPGSALRSAYNPRLATPFYYFIDRGVVRSKGAVGTAEWAKLIRGWQTAAADARVAWKRFT